MKERCAKALPGAAVALLALATGAASLGNGFVWDDAEMVREAAVRELAGFVDIWLRPSTIRSEGHYWPLTWTTFWLDYRAWGTWAPGWHATNVALHAGVAVMAGATLARLGARGAWWAAALFAVHPLHAEVIGWTIARKDSLAALLALAAVWAWARDDACGRGSAWPTVATGAALLAKSSALWALPAMALAQWWRHGKLTGTDWRRLAPVAAIGAAIVGADTVRYAGIDPFELGHDLATRAGAAGWALATQAANLAWPADLTPMRGPYAGGTANTVGWAVLAGAAALTGALWLERERIGRAPAAACTCFIAGLAPTLGLVEFSFLRFSASADRFAYLASIGPLALAGAGLAQAIDWTRRSAGRAGAHTVAAAAVAGLAALGWASAQHTGTYRENVGFFQTVLAHIPNDAEMTFNLSKALGDAGRLEENAQIATAGAKRHPGDAQLAHREGTALRKAGRHAQAAQAYRRALALRPHRVATHVGLGYALEALNDHEGAIAAFTAAYRRAPALRAPLGASIAKAQLKAGRPQAAVATYRAALREAPDDPVLRVNLASVLARTGSGEEALAHARRALAAAPGLAFAEALIAELEAKQRRGEAQR